MYNMLLLSKDTPVAEIVDGKVRPIVPARMPIYLQRDGKIETWLKDRAIDAHRTNSRLLKRTLRLESTDDITTVLSVNAATVTDNFWVKPIDDTTTRHADIKFNANYFDKLALARDGSQFGQKPSRTPELTNTGSFEKCWRLDDGKWWMLKAGKNEELVSELAAYYIGKKLDLDIALYQPEGPFIKSKDFTENAQVDLEPAKAIIDEKTGWVNIYKHLQEYDQSIADAYVQMCYFDALTYNIDRHEFNFGVLRNSDTGKVESLAPLFDHNLAMVALGYPDEMPEREEWLTDNLAQLLDHTGQRLNVTSLSYEDIIECINNAPWPLPPMASKRNPTEYTARLVMDRQENLERHCPQLAFRRENNRDKELDAVLDAALATMPDLPEEDEEQKKTGDLGE